MYDKELITRLEKIFSYYYDDLMSDTPVHDFNKVHLEIHGQLADAQFIDKINTPLIEYLISYIYVRQRNKEETVNMLKDIRDSLHKLSV